MSKKLTATFLLLTFTFLTPQSTPIVVIYLFTNFPSQYLLIMQDFPVLASPIDINLDRGFYYFQQNLIPFHLSFVLNIFRLFNLLLFIQGLQQTIEIQMGNACCAEDTDRKLYDPKLKKVVDFDPTASSITSIKFPVAKITKKHPIVQQLNNEAGKFSAKNPMSIPSGTPSQPRLLNKQGLIYIGEWNNGLPHGKGQLLYPNGAYYVGYFTKGNADGQGRFVSPDGWIYQGELENQQAEGKGILYHKPLKYRFEGIWSGDLPNGYGKQEWLSKNIVYEGQFLNGKKHGQGKYITPEYSYQGIFNNNEFDSRGFISYQNGQKYQGNFDQGKKNGKGVYTWPDGSFYEGFYRNDVKHGQGRYQLADNSYWEGQWSNGKKEGLGSLFVHNKKYMAQWSNGSPISMNTNGKSQINSRRVSGLQIDTFQ